MRQRGGAIVIGVDDVVESLLLNLCLAGVSPPPLSRWIMPERIRSETGRSWRQRIFGNTGVSGSGKTGGHAGIIVLGSQVADWRANT